MRSRCLCQICTCGRHHCPHGTTRIYENSGHSCPTTEYLEKYPTYGNVLPPQSLKPKQEFRACRGKMEGITTFKSDYRPYEIVKQPRPVPEEYKPKQGAIDLGTTYKQDFNSYKVQPVAIVRPLERKQVKRGKVDTVPTYKGFSNSDGPGPARLGTSVTELLYSKNPTLVHLYMGNRDTRISKSNPSRQIHTLTLEINQIIPTTQKIF